MTTYVLLGVPFLLVALAVWLVARARTGGPGVAATGLTMAALVVLTAVFDNAIVGAGIVGYDDSRTLGVRLGVAPVEDLLYSVAAALLLPALWRLATPRPATATTSPARSTDDSPTPSPARSTTPEEAR
jgi:lycopene cyclase domain-containing protein